MGPRPKTAGALSLLTLLAPGAAAATVLAWVRTRGAAPPRATPATQPRTVLVSGGKMTKALALARAFHAAGHRVILVETARYRLTGHRLSRAVDRFHTVPAPQDPGYAAALVEIVRREGVDVYVPVCSPAASFYDAAAKAALAPHCEVLHLDPDAVRRLDDKHAFAVAAADLGLPVPETHRITTAAQVRDVDLAARARPFVLKSIPYDPVRRLDLTPLPRPTPAETDAFVAALPISAGQPWILQELLEGQEYCTHSTVRDGRLQVHVCCRSSAFQVNYEAVEHPAIEAWVRTFVAGLRLTGQVSFDFIEAADGTVRAIECNPRAHSAITTFHDHPGLAAAYLEPGAAPIRPLPGSRPTYWLYHELWRAVSRPRRLPATLRTIARGTDAIFDRHDPLPFLVECHVQIPALLLGSLRRGSDWIRVDFNIGKLVEPAGD